MANPTVTFTGRIGQDPVVLSNGGIRLRVVTNDRVKNDQTGEGSTFLKMLDSTPSDGAAFYCHTKGARYKRTGLGTTKRWAELMYSVCLSRYGDMIADRIETASAVGPFRRTGVIAAPWHFSGNFFCRISLRRSDWRQIGRAHVCTPVTSRSRMPSSA